MTVYDMLEEAIEALARLADVHHRTLSGSRKHDPERREWTDCDCLTCLHARRVVESFRKGDATHATPDYARNTDGTYMTPEQADAGRAL